MNQKNLNYEIETSPLRFVRFYSLCAMNQKNLNYEIETWVSLTSLKCIGRYEYLNYEIETEDEDAFGIPYRL